MAPETETKPKAKPRTTARKPAAPPNRVSPGWVHKALATNILKGIQARASQEMGVTIDVGELPDTETLAKEGGIIDDRQPVDLLSRILAHIFHRTPVLRKVERRLEGKDSSSGVMSDIAAFVTQLYTRNESTFSAVRDQVVEKAKSQAQNRS